MYRLPKGALIGVVVGLVFVAAGCNTSRQRLLGRWEVQTDVKADEASQPKTDGDNPWIAALGSTLMKTLRMSAQLDFRSDDTCTLTVSAFATRVTRAGRWRVDKSEGDTATVLTMFDGESQPRVWEVRFLNEDSFQTQPPEVANIRIPKMVTFQRIKLPQ